VIEQNQNLLVVDGLTKFFPIKGGLWGRTLAQVHAVDRVSFSVEKGKTLGLVGESGCGKSTLGRSLLRLYEPTSGSISFMGKDILAMGVKEMREIRRQMQIVFQDPFSSLNPRMKVGAILAEPFLVHKLGSTKEIRKKIDELLAVVGLPKDSLSRFPHEFSGGQRQRIGIARAIALKPQLIIADEPVSALDVSIQSQILNLMADLKRDFGLTYIFIAHDLAVIEHISDFVAVMYLGKIVEYTDATTIYEAPRHPYTKALISAIPQPEVTNQKSKRQILKGDVPSPINPPSGCHFHPRCPIATEKCAKVAPILEEKAAKAGHLVACHYA
jgi:oligopeptide/dipeptide ABC transporter ATP-binding protein